MSKGGGREGGTEVEQGARHWDNAQGTCRLREHVPAGSGNTPPHAAEGRHTQLREPAQGTRRMQMDATCR